jgi:hypothetical protein
MTGMNMEQSPHRAGEYSLRQPSTAQGGYATSDKHTPSFRGDAKHRTRNLEVPDLVLRTIPE